ncbi:MAG: diguanylate cyclase [Spirochaetales bacterium]|nr:diguanylate cyclase [Spirochaetales bacterium]
MEKYVINLVDYFLQHNIDIFNYLIKDSEIILILFNNKKQIVNCNNYFLKYIGENSCPSGKSIYDFFDVIGSGELKFKTSYIPLNGQIIESENNSILIAHPSHLTENELILAMTKMTNELADLTRELNKKNLELESANKTITKLMYKDPLTGLFNRRRLDELLNKEITKSQRHNLSLSILMIDIDFFKKINDSYGHDIGDVVLVEVSNKICASCREEDIISRFGGEEFIVALPNTDCYSAMECAQRIKESIEVLNISPIPYKVTVSIGVSNLNNITDSQQSLIKRADIALYKAKKLGRNRVENSLYKK